MALPVGRYQEVRAAEKYKQLNVDKIPMYACRLVEKVSSKGRRLRRLLLATDKWVVLIKPSRLVVTRLIPYDSIAKAAFQKTATETLMLLNLKHGTNEPDILFAQISRAEAANYLRDGVSDGTDILDIIRHLKMDLTGSELVIEDKTREKVFDASNCALKKNAEYEIPKVKVVSGDFLVQQQHKKRPAHEQSPSSVDDAEIISASTEPRHNGPTANPKQPEKADTGTKDPRKITKGTTDPAAKDSPPKYETYTVYLANPNQEIGLDYEDDSPIQRLLVTNISPNSPASRAGVPCGVLHCINTTPVNSCKMLDHVITQVRQSQATSFTIGIEPIPEVIPFPLQDDQGPKARVLSVGVGYLGTDSKLRNAATEARNIATTLVSTGFTPSTPETLQILTEERSDHMPTRANLLEAFRWLTAGARAGDAFVFAFVGHCVQDEVRRALYPTDWQTNGTITGENLQDDLLSKIPVGSKLTVIVDSCGYGSLLDLSFNLKAVPSGRGGLLSRYSGGNAQGGLTGSGKVIELSSYKPDNSVSSPNQAEQLPNVVASGGIVNGFCSMMAADPSPTFEELLRVVLTSTEKKVGHGKQVPMVSCNYRGSTSEKFYVSTRKGVLRQAAIRPTGAQAAVRESVGSGPMEHSPTTLRRNIPIRNRRSFDSNNSLKTPRREPNEAYQPPAGNPQHQQYSQQPQTPLNTQVAQRQQPRPQEQPWPQPQPHPQPPPPQPNAHVPHPQPHSQPPPSQLQSNPAPGTLIRPLSPEEIFKTIPPSVLGSKGLSRLLTVQWNNGIPEIFYAAEVVVLEARPVNPSQPGVPLLTGPVTPHEPSVVLWPNAKFLFVGREAIYVLEPNGDVDRCIPLQDVHDFVWLKGGSAVDTAMTPAPAAPSILPLSNGSSANPWLAVRIPSQYELLIQHVDHNAGGAKCQQMLQVVNTLLQQGNVSLLAGGAPARVLVVENEVQPGLLRLLRPQNYSFPWVPLNVRIWPAVQTTDQGHPGPVFVPHPSPQSPTSQQGAQAFSALTV